MDFHRLMARLSEIERRSPVVTENDMMPSMSPIQDPPPHPSMNLNFNAQGIDSIDQMLKLFQKVNPDMMPKVSPMATSLAAPTSSMTNLMSPVGNTDPMSSLDDDDDDSMLALPMDSDGQEDGELDNEKSEIAPLAGMAIGGAVSGAVSGAVGNMMKDEAANFENEPDENYKSIDYMNNQLAGGMNGPKRTYPKVASGDNPMQKVKESGDLRSQIRADLARRLAEAKGAK